MTLEEKTLLDCKPGATYRVSRLEGGADFRSRLETMGLKEGCRIVKLHSHPFRGPVTVRIQHTKLAVGHGMAARVYVEALPASSEGAQKQSAENGTGA